MDWTIAAGLVLSAAFVAFASLLALSVLPALPPPGLRGLMGRHSGAGMGGAASIFAVNTPASVLIFDGEMLVDATPAARTMIAGPVAGGDDGDAARAAWARALSRLEPIFPGLSLRIEGLQREGRFILCSREDVKPPLVLRAENIGGLTRLSMLDAAGEGHLPHIDAAAETALNEEVSGLRETLSQAPLMIWRETAEGAVVWANGAYLRTAADLAEAGQNISWPLPQIFGPSVGNDGASQADRRVLRIEGVQHWFDLTRIRVGQDRLCYALPADRLVAAEKGLRDFMQTLTKTFAHLPIGLAIFDANRVLQMFNPALIDLTGLPAELLIARPTLASLLDAMRERQMIPEPRDYRSWRRQIVDLEQAAASGLYQDTWTLPSGQTYRVTGRPHPNGALAFMFEDISTEMTRTRRYRADLELGQAVIDAMPDAVVVFAQDGAVVMSNRAAGGLWPGLDAAGMSLSAGETLISQWRDMTAPTLLWSDLSAYVGSFGPRDPWEGDLRLKDGRALRCQVAALPHGSTFVSFRLADRAAMGLSDTTGEKAIMIA